MRTMLALAALLYSTAALSQTTPPAAPAPATTYGGKPLVHVQPKGEKKVAAAKSAAPAKPAKQQSTAVRLQICLDIDDGTKERLSCYDEIFPPKPNPKAAAAKGVADCRFRKEEDERLTCYNDFAERIPKLPRS
jgi:hypothetical protein